MFVVVAYDVVSDRRRNKVAGILKDYGERVNYSVFECFAIERQTLNELKTKLAKVISKQHDSLLYYEICEACGKRRDSAGIRRSSNEDKVLIR